jgi:hypothetical protein
MDFASSPALFTQMMIQITAQMNSHGKASMPVGPDLDRDRLADGRARIRGRELSR